MARIRVTIAVDMTDFEPENPDLTCAVDAWRELLGSESQIACRQDLTGYDFVEIRRGRKIARVEQERDGWCLYDRSGDEPAALTECVKHPERLTPVVRAFFQPRQ